MNNIDAIKYIDGVNALCCNVKTDLEQFKTFTMNALLSNNQTGGNIQPPNDNNSTIMYLLIFICVVLVFIVIYLIISNNKKSNKNISNDKYLNLISKYQTYNDRKFDNVIRKINLMNNKIIQRKPIKYISYQKNEKCNNPNCFECKQEYYKRNQLYLR